jgi:excisionase family DNA binding protein
MINPLQDTLIPFTAIAQQLDVSYATVKKWRDRGELEAIRIGGKWHTTEAALTAYVNREQIDKESASQARSSQPKSTQTQSDQPQANRQKNSAAFEQAKQNMRAAGFLS